MRIVAPFRHPLLPDSPSFNLWCLSSFLKPDTTKHFHVLDIMYCTNTPFFISALHTAAPVQLLSAVWESSPLHAVSFPLWNAITGGGSTDVFHGNNNNDSFAECWIPFVCGGNALGLKWRGSFSTFVTREKENEIKPFSGSWMQLRGWFMSHPVQLWIDNVGFYHSFVILLAHEWQCCQCLERAKTDKEAERCVRWKWVWGVKHGAVSRRCCSMNIAKYLNYSAAVHTWISVGFGFTCIVWPDRNVPNPKTHSLIHTTPPGLLVCIS